MHLLPVPYARKHFGSWWTPALAAANMGSNIAALAVSVVVLECDFSNQCRGLATG